jgi:hypothetical protein
MREVDMLQMSLVDMPTGSTFRAEKPGSCGVRLAAQKNSRLRE